MTTALTTLTKTLATKLDMGDGLDLIDTLKATAFKGQVSDAQMTALLVVANQYALNPWTKEIYAFPDKNNGIVPVVGVDGWARIINTHPQFDGIDFEQDAESCTAIIYRKDRSRPIRVTEFMTECKRGTGPWQSHPRRMLRHKAMIQCARLAFGYGGIYDHEEAERIVEATEPKYMGPAEVVPPAPPSAPYPDEKFAHNSPKWIENIASGAKTAKDYIDFMASRNTPLTEEQKTRLLSVKRASKDEPTDVEPKAPPAAPGHSEAFAEVLARIRVAQSQQELTDLDEAIGTMADADERAYLMEQYELRSSELPPF
jgi:phage recombination protein Bet